MWTYSKRIFISAKELGGKHMKQNKKQQLLILKKNKFIQERKCNLIPYIAQRWK